MEPGIAQGIEMSLEPPETVTVNTKFVACDGGEGSLGHPRVFLNLEKDGRAECPYCDKLFLLDAGAGQAKTA